MKSWTQTGNAAAFSIFSARLAGEIDRIAQKIAAIAKTPTLELELEAAILQPLPDIHQGVKDAKVSCVRVPSFFI